jgi:predicted RNA-binding Zn-ribbon protein involved in translation (DUF1610 family)
MADQPSFSRCPYCQRKLEKRPQRKSKCPLCGEVIFVRGGDLMREDEVAAADKKKTAAKKSAKSSSSSSSKKSSAAKKKSAATKKAKSTAGAAKKKSTAKPKSKLESDLKRKKKGAFTQGDLQAGFMLVIQLLGKFFKPEQIAQLLGGLMGGGGAATRSAFADLDTDSLLAEAAQVYDDLDASDQRHLLAVFTWVQNGFSLEENTADAEAVG